MHFEWTTMFIQLLLAAFWIFIIYAVVVLVRNSKENTRTLRRLEEQLTRMSRQLEEREQAEDNRKPKENQA
ncbi:DUF948 domain-containing protein [Paenibacillus rigui]|uniref:DUF4083 domain-containing protein n=1 Tax=Paenibacillus rigui TaxID=554312 RepID=A0A229UKY0_9BACL|nr:DUF948 domain-containing protein [Paenibacillus rigui]OXM83569.1 hypothetical protein CF651_25005 [Paenibacillus rigui]